MSISFECCRQSLYITFNSVYLYKYTDTNLYAVLNKRGFFLGGGMNYYLFALMDRLHKKDWTAINTPPTSTDRSFRYHVTMKVSKGTLSIQYPTPRNDYFYMWMWMILEEFITSYLGNKQHIHFIYHNIHFFRHVYIIASSFCWTCHVSLQ